MTEGRSSLLARAVFRLRPEEAAALVFLVPTFYLTIAADAYARSVGSITARHSGGIPRLAAAVTLLVLLFALLKLLPRAPWVKVLRETLPFLSCVFIYTNLHDTIGMVNPHDIHHFLDGLDRAIFGVQPVLWAEQFITPARTWWMQLFYLSFGLIAPSCSLWLLAKRDWPRFREVTLGIITCFFMGYALYVVFPAAPPRLVLVHEFTVNLMGYPSVVSSLSASAFELLPVDSRAAFPSLHGAISLLAMIYAWRHLRPWFWVLLPISLGLWVSTVYLRHHYTVDLFAGWLLAPVAYGVAPRLDAWWAARQRALGYEPARGAGAKIAPRESGHQ